MATPSIKITKAATSKLATQPLENVAFGRVFSDHMLEANFENGQWTSVEIKPYQPILISPANAAIHYGQSIFEGIKAYRNAAGDAFIFRAYDNFKRFNRSAARMAMPEVPESIFIEGLKQLIAIDKDWIPNFPNHSLYIRPFLFATDDALGVRPSDNYKFMAILCPAGAYHAGPMKIWIEEEYSRAAPGGVGFAKAAGNYAAAMLATANAQQKGYSQVLWTDANEHKWIQEIGAMNVFFVFGEKVVTPDLSAGTILQGITRDSVITLLKDNGYVVEERPLSLDEVMSGYRDGSLTEVFGSGTAVSIAKIQTLGHATMEMNFDLDKAPVADTIKDQLTAIREGRADDKFNWLVHI